MKVTIVFNEPEYSRYYLSHEQAAVEGVMMEVSAVEGALHTLGYDAERLGLTLKSNVLQELSYLDTDVVFNLFEGFSGFPETEPDIPEVLEQIKIPYTGCPAPALKLALNKYEMKLRLTGSGVRTADALLLHAVERLPDGIRYPCIIKPNRDDASHGVSMASVVSDGSGLRDQLKVFFDEHGYTEALVETYIDGREFNATVFGNETIQVAGVSEITFSLPEDMPRIITYAGKWDENSPEYHGTKPVCPALVTDRQRDLIYETVKCSYRISGCRGYARIDMRMNERGEVFVLEVNPNPDISPDSGAALQVKIYGMDYPCFIERIVSLALER